MPLVAWGPLTLSSGWNPKSIEGPNREQFIVEHQIPGREGGIVEYVGSRNATYVVRGFLAASNDVGGGPAAALLSGTGYMALNADDAKDALINLRVSGANLFKVESVANISGAIQLYENDFFYATSINLGLEAGRGYPYYPYAVSLLRASTKTYGQSSGTAASTGTFTVPPYFSGFIYVFPMISGFPLGEMVIGVGLQANTVASGNLRVGIYSSGGGTLQTQSASQPVNSGWNYFPLRPSFVTTSGSLYILGFMSDATTTSGWTPIDLTLSGQNISWMSGQTFANGFPSSISGMLGLSGYNGGRYFNEVLVTM